MAGMIALTDVDDLYRHINPRYVAQIVERQDGPRTIIMANGDRIDTWHFQACENLRDAIARQKEDA